MACKYCAQYVARALKEVPNFEKACRALQLNPANPADAENILKSMGQIGQFGTIRLARKFPFVTDEAEFQMVARTALEFYWMLLDFWEEQRAAERKERAARDAAQQKREAAQLAEKVRAQIDRQERIQARFKQSAY